MVASLHVRCGPMVRDGGEDKEARDPEIETDVGRERFHLFFFNDTATTEIYTLSLHDALPIFLSPT